MKILFIIASILLSTAVHAKTEIEVARVWVSVSNEVPAGEEDDPDMEPYIKPLKTETAKKIDEMASACKGKFDLGGLDFVRPTTRKKLEKFFGLLKLKAFASPNSDQEDIWFVTIIVRRQQQHHRRTY